MSSTLTCSFLPAAQFIGTSKTKRQEKIRNEDLWERAGQEPVAKQILRRKWGWIGHTLRKPASSTTRQALTWNPQGERKRGRPRNSWRQDTEAELKQQGTNWSGMTRAAQNRVRWRRVVDGLCSTGIFLLCWLLNVPATCECISGTDLL